jgi:hypothetical protein
MEPHPYDVLWEPLHAEISAQLHAWRPQGAVPNAQQEHEDLATHILEALTYAKDMLDPWDAPVCGVLTAILSRPRPAPDPTARMPSPALYGPIARALYRWQARLFEALGEHVVSETHGTDREAFCQDFATILTLWLVAPIPGYHPWYDHPEALSWALARTVTWHGVPMEYWDSENPLASESIEDDEC